MSSPTHITSLHNPRVKSLVKLRDQRGRRKAGLFIAEGMREIERALAMGLPVLSVWVCGPLLGEDDSATGAVRYWSDLIEGIEVVTVIEQVFAKIAYVREPEGVLAVFEPPSWSLDRLPAVGHGGLDLVAVGTEKPGNLGAMARTAELAGCRCLIAAGTPVDAMNPNAIRASTGSVFSLPTLTMREDEAIDYLVEQGIRVVAAVVDGDVDHTKANYTGACAIVIGPEDKGLSEPWRDAAARTGGAAVNIRTADALADSLNASVAAGVLLFEAVRQRRAGGLQ